MLKRLLLPALLAATFAAAQTAEEPPPQDATDAAMQAEARAAELEQRIEEKFLDVERRLIDQNELGLRRLEHVEERLDADRFHLDRLALIFGLGILVIFLFIGSNLSTRLKTAEMRVRHATEDAQKLMRDIERELNRPEVQHLHISQILRRLMRQLREKRFAAFADAHIEEVRKASNDPYLPVSLYLIARILVAEHDKDWSVAVQMLEQLREMDGKDPDVLLHLSHVHKYMAAVSADAKAHNLHERLSYEYYGKFTAVMKAENAVLDEAEAIAPPPKLPKGEIAAEEKSAPDEAAVPPPAPAAAAVSTPPPAAAPAPAPEPTPPPAPKPKPAPLLEPAPTAPAPTPTPVTPPPAEPKSTPSPVAAPAAGEPATATATAIPAAKKKPRFWEDLKRNRKEKKKKKAEEKAAAVAAAPSTPPSTLPAVLPPAKPKGGALVNVPSPAALVARLRQMQVPFSARGTISAVRRAGWTVASALARLLKQADDGPLPFLPVPATSVIPKDVEKDKLAMWQELRRGDLTMAKATEAGTMRERNRLIDEASVYYAQAQAHSTNETLYHNWGIARLAKALHVPEKKRAPFYNEAVDKFLAGNVIVPHYFDFHLASLYAIIGNKAECRKWLETAKAHGNLNVEALRQAPDFDSIRQEPWFKEFV